MTALKAGSAASIARISLKEVSGNNPNYSTISKHNPRGFVAACKVQREADGKVGISYNTFRLLSNSNFAFSNDR
jgi:hypothetical protein